MVRDASLRIVCRPLDDGYELTIEGQAELPPGVRVQVWPVSFDRANAKPWDQAIFRPLGPKDLTAFIGFEIATPSCAGAGAIRFVLKLLAEGFPEDRDRHVLKAAVSNSEGFFRYLQALLAGVDGFQPPGPPPDPGDGGGAEWTKRITPSPTMLEDLLRVAARHPERLEPVRRLVDDLTADESDDEVIPPEFVAVWRSIEAAVFPDTKKGA